MNVRWKRFGWSGVLGLCCLLGCFSAPTRPPDPMHLAGDSDNVRREVLKHVPFGMPLKQARGVLEANGFSCRNDRGARVLICDITPPQRQPIRVWLHYDPEDTVKDVQVRCDFHPRDNE